MAYGAIMGQALAASGGTSPFGMCGPLTCYVGDGNYTFTAQMKGKYKVTAISGGGDGGDGIIENENYRTGASSGGSGAVAIYIEDFDVNNTLNISISSKTVTIGGNKLALSAGGNGQNAPYDSGTSLGGTAGAVTRSTVELLFSANGSRGVGGGNRETVARGASINAVVYYPAVYHGKLGAFVAKGEDGAIPSQYNYNNTQVLTYPELQAFGGYVGSGGDGGAVILRGDGSGAIQNPTGGKGGPAAVIIEYLGDF